MDAMDAYLLPEGDVVKPRMVQRAQRSRFFDVIAVLALVVAAVAVTLGTIAYRDATDSNTASTSNSQGLQSLSSKASTLTTTQRLQALVASHPLCSSTVDNWHACNDLIATGENLLTTSDDVDELGQAVRNDEVSVGSAHAFLAHLNGTITHADSFLSDFEGTEDQATSTDNCARIMSNNVCLQTYYMPESDKMAVSFLIGDMSGAATSRRRDISWGGELDAAAGGAIKGAITGAVGGLVTGGPGGALAGAAGGAAAGAAGGMIDYTVNNW